MENWQKEGNFKEIPKHLDATDGLAVAICHTFYAQSKLNNINIG